MSEYELTEDKVKIKTIVDTNLETIVREYLHSRDVQLGRIVRIIEQYKDLIDQITYTELALLDEETRNRLKAYHPGVWP